MPTPGSLATIMNDVLGVPGGTVRADVPQQPAIWDELRGGYRLPGPLADARARLAMAAGMEVLVRDGRLVLRT
ncbi:MAG TPA: hypothetical protein VIU11_10715 [Nakamurella sp.]